MASSNTTHSTIRSDIQQHLEDGLDAADLKFLDAWPLGTPRKQPETFNGIAIEKHTDALSETLSSLPGHHSSSITLVPLMNSLLHLHSIASPYLKAARLFYRSTTAIANSLSSDRALSLYKKTAWLAWLLAQLAFWAFLLAMKQSVRFGEATRRYYEAEWAHDINALVKWLLTYPDQCIQTPQNATAAIPTVNQDAQDAIATSIPKNIQSILSSNRSATNKLRAIATQCNINWHNAHGRNKHLSNQEIRNALAAFPTILKQF